MRGKANLVRWFLCALFLLVARPTATVHALPPEPPRRPRIVYVDADAAGANDGSSWADAFNNLQDAITTASAGCEIRVAQGTYKPNEGLSAISAEGGRETIVLGRPGELGRNASFQLKTGVIMEGGYAGFGQDDPDERDIEAYRTVLSGDLNGDDVDVDNPWDFWREPTRAENSYHVVTGSRTDETAVLDGFIITGGNGELGGGMYNKDGSPTLTNCTFTGNSATYGGGMYNEDSNPILTNCTFADNLALGLPGFWRESLPEPFGEGGGMYNSASNPTLTDSTFSGNLAPHGGGMRNEESRPDLTGCGFVGNKASWGGGMANGGSDPTLTDCVFIGNEAFAGGGMGNEDSSPNLTHCRFVGNEAARGGGMHNNTRSNTSSPTLANCAFTNNVANPEWQWEYGSAGEGGEGGGMYNWDSSPTLTNCIFSGKVANREKQGQRAAG
ncbi:MAG: right-handed parallel beta-helix repeat-containing protein, partial [Phycisphaerales bacterium]